MKLYRLNVTADGEPTAISPWPKISAVFSMPLSMRTTARPMRINSPPYFDEDRKPRVIRSLDEVPEEYLDFVCLKRFWDQCRA